MEVYTLPQLRLFYREALAHEAEAAKMSAIVTRAAQHAKKEGFAKLLKRFNITRPKAKKSGTSGGNNADNLLNQIKAAGLPIHTQKRE
ncbi:MAG: hypothetical protein Alpg2KO_00540 [Alphaproteobacteria bacterium]